MVGGPRGWFFEPRFGVEDSDVGVPFGASFRVLFVDSFPERRAGVFEVGDSEEESVDRSFDIKIHDRSTILQELMKQKNLP